MEDDQQGGEEPTQENRPGMRPDGAAGVHVALHYFSGTGNTFRVASWFAETARARGAQVTMTPISARGQEERVPAVAAGRRMLGVLAPTHGFTAPWAALTHAATVHGVRGADVFAVVTRAGWYAGPLRLPGLEGTAAWLLALMLVLRGGRLVGVRAVDMPSNWTALHWGMNDAHVAAILKAAKTWTSAFAESILGGRRRLTGWLALATGLVLAPVSLLYLLVARPLLGKLFFADERCTSCALCSKHCPFQAVHMRGGPPRRPFWTSDCQSCMRCMNICPERAIQANWLFAAAQTWVMLAVLEAIAGAAAIVACAAILALTGPLYRIVWVLDRPRAAAWLLGHTTPTRFFRRYREPGTDLRDI